MYQPALLECPDSPPRFQAPCSAMVNRTLILPVAPESRAALHDLLCPCPGKETPGVPPRPPSWRTPLLAPSEGREPRTHRGYQHTYLRRGLGRAERRVAKPKHIELSPSRPESTASHRGPTWAPGSRPMAPSRQSTGVSAASVPPAAPSPQAALPPGTPQQASAGDPGPQRKAAALPGQAPCPDRSHRP